ncbi:MAG: alpha/beta hydrolase [Pseudomonadota bacterium]
MRWWLAALLASAGILVAAFVLSPWPSVYLIRFVFDRGAAAASAKLEKHLPQTISTTTASYDPSDKNAILDVYRPPQQDIKGPVVVWIHGGGFVSGRRADIANYLKVLAGRGFVVVNVDYTIAPEAKYPMPVRQVGKALAFLAQNGGRLGVDANRIVLAGDSAGAQIAAQTAAIVTNSDYARRVGVAPADGSFRLAGALLFCGIYDITGMGRQGGILGWFVGSTTWAYSGARDWRNAKGFETMSVAPNITGAFPPTLISAGNADPLGPQSAAMAAALKAKGVNVQELFFPADYQPGLGHEYQFDLDTEAGQLALSRTVDWLGRL